MDGIGQTFFSLLFEKRPELMRLFSFRDDPQWRTSRGLKVGEGRGPFFWRAGGPCFGRALAAGVIT